MSKQITMESVTVAFASADGIQTVLQDIELEIQQGEWLCIIGRNGSGKSTLGKVLAGLCAISRGQVQSDLDLIQMVFQNPEAQIVGETVYEDVCFGMENRAIAPAAMPARADAALRQVGMEHLRDHLVEHLSGGQKQLLGIAGCLAVDADVIVFDEATAMLDPATRQRVLQVVQDLHRQGRTILWITQWMDELAHADRVLALEGGRVAYVGGNREFFYGTVTGATESPCEALDFVPPYAVQVAKSLQQRGLTLTTNPISPEEVSEAVSLLCR